MNFQKSLLQGLLWRGLYFVSVLLVNVFISRYLQAAGGGWIYYLSNIFSFALLFLSISLDAGINYFAPADKIATNKLFWFTISWSLIVVLISFIVVWIYIHMNGTLPVENAEALYYFGVYYITGLFFANCGVSLFHAKGNFFLPNVILVACNIGCILFIPKTVMATNIAEALPALKIYFFFFLVQGLSIMIAWLIKHKAYKNIVFPGAVQTKQLLRFSFVALLANVIFFLVYRIDYYFVDVSPVCTAEDLGNYIQVSKLGQMLLIIPQIIASVIYPGTASELNRKELNNAVMIIARLFSQLYLLLFIVVLVAGRWFFPWLFGNSYNAMQLPFMLLLPGIFCLSVLALVSAYFGGKGKVKVNVTAAFIALIVVAAGDYIFVPLYGIIAAAIVSTVGYAVNLAYTLFAFYKDYAVNLADFFRWRASDYLWVKNLFIKPVK